MKANQVSLLLKALLIISILAFFSVGSYAAFSFDLVAKVAVTSFDALTKAQNTLPVWLPSKPSGKLLRNRVMK